MSELGSIVKCAQTLRRAGEPFLLATVVRVRGSAYRHPGARLLVTSAESIAGSISGGCLERDVVSRGFWHVRESPAVLVTYDARSDEDARKGLGLGCDGIVDVLLERIDPRDPCDPIEVIARALASERPTALATVYRSTRAELPVGARLAIDEEGNLATNVTDSQGRAELARAAESVLRSRETTSWWPGNGSFDALVEPLLPAPHLFVFGDGHDAVPVVQMAKMVGFTASVCARQARFVTRERFAMADAKLVLAPEDVPRAVAARARPFAAVLSHDYEYDRDVVHALLRARVEYIGILGPRRRSARMLAEIGRTTPLDAADLARVHAPVGLDIGAETPAQVALAIVAEAQAVLASRPGAKLRDRIGAIHDPWMAEPLVADAE